MVRVHAKLTIPRNEDLHYQNDSLCVHCTRQFGESYHSLLLYGPHWRYDWMEHVCRTLRDLYWYMSTFHYFWNLDIEIDTICYLNVKTNSSIEVERLCYPYLPNFLSKTILQPLISPYELDKDVGEGLYIFRFLTY